MDYLIEINYEGIEKNQEYNKLLNRVAKSCFCEERIDKSDLYINVILSDEKYIHKINKEYRVVDRPTDVLSFPMFQKDEIPTKKTGIQEVLGDIIICIPIVERQAIEYEHSFERELAYMFVHGFCHLMGYDHIEEADKKQMREKEEKILSELKIIQ